MTEPYWYVDHLGFERTRTRQNDLRLGLRFWSEAGTRKTEIGIAHPVTLATRRYGPRETDALLSVVSAMRITDPAGPITVYMPSTGGIPELPSGVQVVAHHAWFSVAHMRTPFRTDAIDKLPGDVNRGNYDFVARCDLDLSGRKVVLDPRLLDALDAYERLRAGDAALEAVLSDVGSRRHRSIGQAWRSAIDELACDGRIGVGEVLARSAKYKPDLVALERRIDSLGHVTEGMAHDLSAARSASRLLDERNAVTYLADAEMWRVRLASLSGVTAGERLTVDEWRRQVWGYGDIEIPLWYEDDVERKVDARAYLIESRRRKRVAKPEGLEEELSRLEGCDDPVAALERELTVEIAGKTVQRWTESHREKITWVASLYCMPDGEEIRELHTIHDVGVAEVNGYRVMRHRDERTLLNAVTESMKLNNVVFFANHNLPYDIMRMREAGEGIDADEMDFFLEGRIPGRSLSIGSFHRRMRDDIHYVDTYRLAAAYFAWMRAKDAGGKLRLDAVSQLILGKDAFVKTLNYDQLRDLEVLAIGGDTKAALRIAQYATSDVEPVRNMLRKHDFLTTIMRVQNIFPYATISEVAFSPGITRKFFAWREWVERHAEEELNCNPQDRMREIQRFVQRFPDLKRQLLTEQVTPTMRTGQDVTQCYPPLELWLRPVAERIYPAWKGFFEDLSEEPLLRIGQLQYPRAFLRDMLADHHEVMRTLRAYRTTLAASGLDDRAANGLAHRRREEVREYATILASFERQHGALYERSSRDEKRRVRGRRGEKEGQQHLDVVGAAAMGHAAAFRAARVEREHGDRATLRRLEGRINAVERRALAAGVGSDALYAAAIGELLRRRYDAFRDRYGLPSYAPNDVLNVRTAIHDGYAALGRLLRGSACELVDVRGDYAYVAGDVPPTDLIVPLRRITGYVPVQLREKVAPDATGQLALPLW